MSDAWNLGDGLENVCRSVLRKAHYASHQTEEKPRTIINLKDCKIWSNVGCNIHPSRVKKAKDDFIKNLEQTERNE